MCLRVNSVENQEMVKIDRITKKILLNMNLGSKVLIYNAPLDLSITIEKAYEIKEYSGRKVVYDLKKFIITDNGESKPFRTIELTNLDTIKKYVTALYESRLKREIKYIKLLIEKDICIGDAVKRTTAKGSDYLVVLPFEDTNADRFIVRCLKLDKKYRVTDTVIKAEIRSLRRMRSIKIKK